MIADLLDSFCAGHDDTSDTCEMLLKSSDVRVEQVI